METGFFAMTRFHSPSGPTLRGIIPVAAAAIGLSACLQDTVLPEPVDPAGRPFAATILAGDTIVEIGSTFELQAEVTDSLGRLIAHGITWATNAPAIQVTSEGVVTASMVGAGYVRVERIGDGLVLDSIRVAVVPRGELVWVENGRIRIGNLTGHSMPLTASLLGPEVVAAPDGQRWVSGGRTPMIIHRDGGAHPLPTRDFVADPTGLAFDNDPDRVYFRTHLPGERWFIYRLRLDGTHYEKVGPENASNPAPSPDGTRLAYILLGMLTVLDLSTGDTTAVASGPKSARWSPDGAWIAYTDNVGGLALVAPDGGESLRIGSLRLHPDLTWSPNSRFVLAVDATPGGTNRGVTLIDVVDHAVIGLGWHGRWPTWSPTSR